MSTPACLFMVYLTQLNIDLFQFYSFTNCLSSLFQQSVRLISLCNRLSRSFLSRSNISVARSDDTLVSYICSVLLRNQKKLKEDHGDIKNQNGQDLHPSILLINFAYFIPIIILHLYVMNGQATDTLMSFRLF